MIKHDFSTTEQWSECSGNTMHCCSVGVTRVRNPK